MSAIKFAFKIFLPLLIATSCRTTDSEQKGINNSMVCRRINRPADCSWYRNCLDDSLKCGKDGYPLGYGEKYCRRFAAMETNSLCEKNWRDGVAVCLEERALSTALKPSVTCEMMRDDAFSIHPECYTREPDSICYLPFSWAKVALKIDFKDYWSVAAIKQVIKTADICIEQIGSAIARRETPICIDDTEDSGTYWATNMKAWIAYRAELEAKLGNGLTEPDK